MSHRVARGPKNKPAPPQPPVPDGKRPRSRKKNKLSDQNMKIHADTKAFVRNWAEEERVEDEARLAAAGELLRAARIEAREKCG